MKPIVPFLASLLLLASCAPEEPEPLLSNKTLTEVTSVSEDTTVVEDTSIEEVPSTEEEPSSDPSSEESTIESTSEQSTLESTSEIMTPDSGYVPVDVSFSPSNFPEKENNTYPEGKTIGTDPYVFSLEAVMQGSQDDINGTPTPCFQMRTGSKGGSAITSTTKLTGILSLTYLIKKTSYGDFTGSLTAYVGDSLDAMIPLDPAGEVTLKGQRENVFTCEFEDKYISLRNESKYAVNGTLLEFHATNVTDLG